MGVGGWSCYLQTNYISSFITARGCAYSIIYICIYILQAQFVRICAYTRVSCGTACVRVENFNSLDDFFKTV